MPIHGDSDIYVSRYNMFPNKTDYEKRSMRVGSSADHVEYLRSEKKVQSLVGTYYVGIYGYTYATYGVLVQMKRKTSTKEENLKAQTVQLYEGIPI